jgi:hypothetical protein
MKVGRVSRRGHDFLRRSLYEAANALLTRTARFSALKSWGLRIAKRGGFRSPCGSSARSPTHRGRFPRLALQSHRRAFRTSFAQHRLTPALTMARESQADWFFNGPRIPFMRNALAYVPKGQNTVVAAATRQVFLQSDDGAATQKWRHVADQLRGRWPKLGECMDAAERDVLA